MDIDIALLAQQVATVLIPYLVKGGEAFAGEAGKKLASALWEKFKPKVEEREAAKEIIEDLKTTPDDKGARDSFEYQIRKILERDTKFAEEVSITIGEIDLSSIQVGDKNIIGRDFNNAQVATGEGNVLIGSLKLYFESRQIDTPAEQEKVQKALRIYLEKLRRHCNALPLAALGGDENADDEITLDKVYIQLDTTQPKDLPENAQEGRARVRGKVMSIFPDENPPLSLMEAAIATNRLVILGDAGAGKSTFVKELLALQSGVLLGETKGEPLKGFSPDLMPVLVILRELTPRLVKINLGNLSVEKQKVALADAVIEKIHDDVRSLKADDFLPVVKDTIENGKVLLVLDGLDEVPQDARGLIRQAVGALIQLHRIERIIITSRSRSYTGQAVFQNFQPFTIAPFDQGKINQFSRAWYNERQRLGHIPSEQIASRADNLSSAATDPDLIEMSGNPMMLTSIALLHQRDIGLPRERVKLYNLIVTVLISRWQKYKTGEEDFVPSENLARFIKDDNRLRATLELLAYETHHAGMNTHKSGTDDTEADLSRSHALTLLERPENIGNLSLASEFLDYVDQRAGLLMGKGGDLELPTSYSFPHRTIQEYLAGCYLIGKREPGREFFDHAGMGDFWSLAALMGAEELFFNRRSENSLLDLAYYLCPSKSPETEQEERAVLWSGQFACLVGIEIIQRDGGNPRSGEEYLKQLIPLTISLLNSRLTPRERAEAGDTLAKLGDPRFDAQHWHLSDESLLGFVHIPAGEFLMGTQEKDIKTLIEKFGGQEDWYKDETPQHKLHLSDYFMARYPVTVAQFKNFVEDSGYTPQDENSLRGVLTHPVVYVTWYDALAYCKWLNGKLRQVAPSQKAEKEAEQKFWRGIESGNLVVTLPSEAEWEKAARGIEGNVFPWGNEFDQDRVNNNNVVGGTSSVGCFPLGASPYGIQDMSGNVWEWTRSEHKKYPLDPKAKLEKVEDRNVVRVLRGGAFDDNEWLARCAVRYGNLPYGRYYSVGFRVVAAASPISL